MKNKMGLFLLGFAAGIWIVTYLPLPRGFLLFGLFVCSILVVANKYFFWKKSMVYLILLFVLLGGLRQQDVLEHRLRSEIMLANKRVELAGMISEEPVERAETTDYLLRAKDGGRVLVKVKNEDLAFQCALERGFDYGDHIIARGMIKPPSPPTNPGQFNYLSYCRKQGISGVMYAEEVTFAEAGKAEEVNHLIRLALHLKKYLKEVLRHTLAVEDYAIVEGLIFGGTHKLQDEFKVGLQKTGIIHVLSVSGFHVGLLLSGVLLITRSFGAGNRVTVVAVFTILLLYAFMTGLRPSVMRAFVMALFPLLGLLLERKGHWENSLALAGMVLLAWNPGNLFMAGAQLSVAATWGILYLTGPMKKICSFLPESMKSPIAVILAAQLSTLPLLAYYFNYISLVALLANLLLVPLLVAVILLVTIAMLAGLIFLPAAYLLNIAVSSLLLLIKYGVWYISQVPFAVMNVRTPEAWEILVYYGIVFLGAGLYHKEVYYFRVLWFLKRNKRILAAGVAVLLCGFIWQSIMWPSRDMQVTFLDVAGGDSAVVVTPDQEVIVIDTGGPSWLRKNFDPGRYILVPYLRSQGIRKVDLLVISHFHEDHSGGIGALISEFPVKAVLVPPQDIDAEEKVIELMKLLANQGIRVLTPLELKETTFGQGIKLGVLGPGQEVFAGTSSDINNNSLVIKITYDQISYLFTGDIELEGAQYYAAKSSRNEDGVQLGATLIKVPHHGSKGSLDEVFYDQVNPMVGVVSVGRNNFGHPHDRVIEALVRRGAGVYRTDTGGAVLTVTDGKRIKVWTYLKEELH